MEPQNNGAIVGGKITPENHFAAQSTVALLTSYEGEPFSFCTGSLIAKNLILTASHCLEWMKKDEVFVHFGTKLPQSFSDAKTFKVLDWITHPQYETVFDEKNEPISGRNDIALLAFEGELPLNVKPAPLASSKIKISKGDQLVLAGYGIIEEISGPIYSSELRHVQVSVAKLFDQIIVTDQNAGKGACSGDSGGPAYLRIAKNHVVVGVTRGPHDKANDCRHFGEYTSILEYRDFIIESARNLNQSLPQFIDLNSKTR